MSQKQTKNQKFERNKKSAERYAREGRLAKNKARALKRHAKRMGRTSFPPPTQCPKKAPERPQERVILVGAGTTYHAPFFAVYGAGVLLDWTPRMGEASQSYRETTTTPRQMVRIDFFGRATLVREDLR